MKVCSKWVCLKFPGWILSVFMHFYEGLDGFWTVLSPLSTFFDCFRPCLAHFGHTRATLGPKSGHYWNHFGLNPGSLGVTQGYFLPPFWHRLEFIFGPFWAIFEPFFQSFLRFFGDVLGPSTQNWAKMMQVRAKICKFPENSPKLC